jgi:hypothetical protein
VSTVLASPLPCFTGEFRPRGETAIPFQRKAKEATAKKRKRRGRSPAWGYDSWDWDKTNTALARENGVSPVTVSRYRSRLQKPKVTKWSSFDCAGWNWNQSNSELAREHALPIHVVIKKRRQFGMPPFQRAPKLKMNAKQITAKTPRFDIDWKSLDWNEANIRLSERIGCTRELVRQKRAELGQPKLSVYEKKYTDFVGFLQGRNWATPKDFAEFGISFTTGKNYLRRAQLNYMPTPRNEGRRKASPPPPDGGDNYLRPQR